MTVKEFDAVLDEFNRGEIQLSNELKIHSVHASDYENAEGESAIWVSVVLDDNTRPEDLTGGKTLRIQRAIRDWFSSKDVDLFPYVQFTIHNEVPAGDEAE